MLALADQGWSAHMVEERLVEAILVFALEPDREKRLHHVGSSMPEYRYSQWDMGNWVLPPPPPRVPAVKDEIDRAHQTLAWLAITTFPQRLVMRHVLTALAEGKIRIPWRKIKKKHGWGLVDSRTLKKRYAEGLQAIADALDEGRLEG